MPLVGAEILWEEDGFQFGFRRWQGWAHTPSIAFRHLPPTLPELVTPLKGHSQTPNSGLRHTSFSRQVPESGVRSVGHSLSPRSWMSTDAVSANITVEATHTPSIAFRHPPPNSTRCSYTTEGALFISAQLSSDAVSALRKVRVLIWLEAT